ncbi:hypothetical protein RQ359_001938 [Sulfuracidifex metallicus DSM 6482 = JCM 9184]|nr:hypothetical protein RQ359_001938 [Sulfuracidifex metallicus DSM 6482 = JCM 9184]
MFDSSCSLLPEQDLQLQFLSQDKLRDTVSLLLNLEGEFVLEV